MFNCFLILMFFERIKSKCSPIFWIFCLERLHGDYILPSLSFSHSISLSIYYIYTHKYVFLSISLSLSLSPLLSLLSFIFSFLLSSSLFSWASMKTAQTERNWPNFSDITPPRVERQWLLLMTIFHACPLSRYCLYSTVFIFSCIHFYCIFLQLYLSFYPTLIIFLFKFNCLFIQL